ncbi:MAG: alpha-amylase [Treponema sp.]|jgi:glycosidase|nr:alpha-amylase [Treponema sp.]
MKKIDIVLSKFERGDGTGPAAARRTAVMEFHIRRELRDEYKLESRLFSLTGNVVLIDLREVRNLAAKFNAKAGPGRRHIRAGQLHAMGLIDEILHYMVALYREQVQGDVFDTALERLNEKLGRGKTEGMLHAFGSQFPPQAVYAGSTTVDSWLKGSEGGESCRTLSLEEILLLALANLNPAFKPFLFLFDDADLKRSTVYPEALEEIKAHLSLLPAFGPDGMTLWDLLRAPALASPDSLSGQLEYLRSHWGLLLGKFMARLLTTLDVMREEEKPFFGGPGPTQVITYGGLDEYEKFSPDQDWMPRTVLMAKSTLVWLYQLSKKYGREINRLDEIPDEELDELARRGFTGLWLIGLWERSSASRTIKQWTGNPDAAASAYSLYDYDIAAELGGWGALVNLRERCFRRGIRLGSDMVPNHTGIDSRWVIEHPDRFLQLSYPPFPGYTYNCGNLSGRSDVTVQIEEHYFSRTDAAVVFKRTDNRTGNARYIYHGNDGTSMPWNDTAQIDFLNPEAREAVIRTIIGVCQQFSIVRFDAAMTLAKRHIQRLWYPEPGRGGDIASRAEHAISNEEFNRRIPNEFWREVVDRCAAEAPHTLLLAEAFWMMEGYFVRTLGMHRVYNSAFMNMLKNEENGKYRATIKNTLEFDPEILKRFVNFMNNPDEETAVAQFGKGDKYFGICTLLVTMPGLPMFGHGQIEGFEEKYGMEYRRAYRDERPDAYLVDRHEREIFPLMKKRHIFSGSAAFRLYDFYSSGGQVNENVFAYSNRNWDERALVLYNNSYYETSGWIKQSSPAIPQEDESRRQDTLTEALSIHGDERYFSFFREQRSGLWFIRSSKELSERGLFVALKGYESQVFLDIHEREDGAGGPWSQRWSRLNHELNGRGTGDPDAAAADLFLGAIYRPFTELLAPQLVQALETAVESAGTGAPASLASLVKECMTPILDFTEAAAEYLDGAGGNYEPFVYPGFGPAPEDAQQKAETKAKIAARALAQFSASLEQLIGIGTSPVTEALRPLNTAGPGTAGTAGTAGEGTALAARRELVAYALGYTVLALSRALVGPELPGKAALALLNHWQLDRKLRDCFRDLGFSGDVSWRIVELMKALLDRTHAATTDTGTRDAGTADAEIIIPEKPSAGAWAATLIAGNYHADDFRRILGVNRFNDITWFSKEAFEESLLYLSYFLLIEDGEALGPVFMAAAGTTGKAGFIADFDQAMLKAEKNSGYRLDNLIKGLAGAL